tara:strand:+ start:4404 stop:4751 length:348 start_codon:yes stop_codon:yes gene_type:complete
MARKRARTQDGHFVADDPSTPENEAYVSETVAVSETAAKKAVQKKAPKAAPSFSVFVSAEPENAVFDLRLADNRVMGVWDGTRQYVTWQVPTDLKEAAMMHHHYFTGRIISAEDD